MLEQAALKKGNAKLPLQNEDSPEEYGGAVEDGDDEEETTLDRGRSNLQFVENPELVRARFEERRQSKMKPWQRENQQPTRNVTGEVIFIIFDKLFGKCLLWFLLKIYLFIY